MKNTIVSLGGVIITLIGLPLYNLAQSQVAKGNDNDINKIA